MANGKLMQWDTPFDLYHEPKTLDVANFIGEGTFIKGEIINQTDVKTDIGNIKGHIPHNYDSGEKVQVLIRPDDIVDGYNDLRKIISHSQHYIKNGGWLIVEHGYNQGLSVRELFNTNGFTASTLKDYNQLDRLTYGKLR